MATNGSAKTPAMVAAQKQIDAALRVAAPIELQDAELATKIEHLQVAETLHQQTKEKASEANDMKAWQAADAVQRMTAQQITKLEADRAALQPKLAEVRKQVADAHAVLARVIDDHDFEQLGIALATARHNEHQAMLAVELATHERMQVFEQWSQRDRARREEMIRAANPLHYSAQARAQHRAVHPTPGWEQSKQGF